MHELNVFGQHVAADMLSVTEVNYLSGLPSSLPSLEWVWDEMDRVWDSYGLDNTKSLDKQQDAVNAFYGHPVWLMNALYTERDPDSRGHRNAISRYLYDCCAVKIADYGGGGGVLAEAIAQSKSQVQIDIVEPYPSIYAKERLKKYPSITFMDSLEGPEVYDVCILQDVLEHVNNPIDLACLSIEAVKFNGLLVFANCFYPVIKCHLPSVFYLRHQFRVVMKYAGLDYVGCIPGAEHAQVFKRNGPVRYDGVRKADGRAKRFGPLMNKVRDSASKAKSLVKGLRLL